MEANAGKSFQMQILSNIFPRISLHCKLVPVQYREYEYGLLPTLFLHGMAFHCSLSICLPKYLYFHTNLFIFFCQFCWVSNVVWISNHVHYCISLQSGIQVNMKLHSTSRNSHFAHMGQRLGPSNRNYGFDSQIFRELGSLQVGHNTV